MSVWTGRLVLIVTMTCLSACAGDQDAGPSPAEAPHPPDASDAASTDSGLATELIVYVPEVPAASQDGSCWTQSIAAGWSSLAWRCMVGNAIHDPCLVASDGETIVCGVPDAADEFRIELTEPLPEADPSDYRRGMPWRLELSDGAICEPFTGTLPPSKLEVTYGCSDGSALAGGFTKGTVWTIDRVTFDPETRDAEGLLVPVTETLGEVLRAWLPDSPDDT